MEVDVGLNLTFYTIHSRSALATRNFCPASSIQQITPLLFSLYNPHQEEFLTIYLFGRLE
jgi:hypothetical protein